MSESLSSTSAVSGELKVVGSDHAIAWISQGWRLFVAAPGVWIGISVVMMVIQLVLSVVPFIGGIASAILTPVFVGGVMAGCAAIDRGEPLQFDCLFQGFRSNTGNLVTVGVLYLVGVLLICAIGMGLLLVGGGGAIISALAHSAGNPAMSQVYGELLMSSIGIIFVTTCVVLLLFVPLLMTLWFAPALVMLDGVAPAAAMNSSLKASLRNWLPFTIYGIVVLVLMVVAAIPLMLGYLVLLPVLMGSVYASYSDIFVK